MKKILFASAAAVAVLASTPALAQDASIALLRSARSKPRVGYDKVKALGEKDGGALFGIGAGYDYPVSDNVSIGADVEASDFTQEESAGLAEVEAGRDLYAGGRSWLCRQPVRQPLREGRLHQCPI